MHKFFRNFILIALFSLVVAWLVIVAIYRQAMSEQLVELAQRESMALTHVLGVFVKANQKLQVNLEQMTSVDFRRTPEFGLLDNLIRQYVGGFDVLQVNIYNLKGIVIYSTDMSRLGRDYSSSQAFQHARHEVPDSKLVTVDHFFTLDGTTLNREMVNSYIPVDWSGEGKLDAVVQVYVDVTGRTGNFESLANQNYLYYALTILGLFAVFLVLIKTAEKKVKAHERVIVSQRDELDRFVYRDSVTGLPNRALFLDRLGHAMQKACQYEKLLAVLSLDLRRFKYVNDKFGFKTGDKLLVQVADRIKRCVHDYDTASRLNGGNFAIVLEDLSVVDEASEAANHILDVLSDAFLIDGQEIFIAFSIGIAIYPFDDDVAESLIQKADTALYQAKDAGRNTYRFYSSAKRELAVTRFSMENALRHAFERNEFLIYYQPIVQINGGNITGVEALLRWRSPSRGVVPPLEFISVLEDSGLIIQVGQWVLETACKQGKAWQQQGYGDLKININISARQFKDKNLLSSVEKALELSELSPHLLNLEITESLLIENRDRVIEMLDLLNEKGVSMSVDDFGTGYSSMAYLKSMPIETIKIDKTFVRGIPFDTDDVAIIHAIDYLSKQLRLNVIAEGVETREQLEFLQGLNVFAIQGYLISRPVPAGDIEKLFAEHVPPV